MLRPKIKLTNDIRAFILEERKKANKTAEEVSVGINRAGSWLSQVENGRLQNINRVDFINIISFLLNISQEESELYIEDFLKSKKLNINTHEQMSFFDFTDLEENKGKKQKNEFDKCVKDIVTGFNYMFKIVDDKEDALKIIKNICVNMHSSDLGFILSLYSMPWCSFTELDYETKGKIIKDLYDFIKKEGLTCEDCENCNEKKHTE